MTWRLVANVVFIERRSLTGAVVIIGLVSRPSGWEWLIGGVALMIAAAAGANTSLDKRELVVLPISPGELHRAGWILAAVLPLVVLTLARILGGAWHTITTDDGWAFHATPVRVLFEMVYLSLVGAWAVRTPDRYEPSYDEDPNLYRFLLGVLVMAAVPFVVIPWLPESLSAVPPMLWVVFVAALGFGVSPLLRTPEWHRRDSPPVTTEPTPLPLKIRGEVLALPAFRSEGLWIPMRGVAGQALTWIVIMLGFTAVLGATTKNAFSLWGPFDASLTDLRFLMTAGLLPMFFLGLSPGLSPWIGALKRLPLSSRETALLLSVAPATMPIMYWAALLVIHLVTAWQWPDVLRLGILTALIGSASLADAVGTKGGSSMVKMAAGATVVMAFAYAADENRPLLTAIVDHWALSLVGLLCFGLSWLLNLHTLARSSGSSRAFRFNRSWQSARAR